MKVQKRRKMAFTEAARVYNAMGKVLNEIYELGKAEGIEEKDAGYRGIEEDARADGFEAGYNEGYEDAMKEFHMPDL